MKREFPIELAERIVEMLYNVTENNVNFMGEDGKILASIQKQRIGTIHEGAKRIMAGEINELAITVEDAEKLQGAMAGYNGVVFSGTTRIGCIGLTGDPEQMRPLQKLAAIITKDEYENFVANQNREEVVSKVAEEIEGMTAAIEEITAGSIESFNHIKMIEEKVNIAEEYIGNINRVLNVVKNISDQTKLLGLNAAIEAARAGEAGRGFAVVSQEIGKLSTLSANSVGDINQILNGVRDSIMQIAEGIRNSSKIAEEQSDALQDISKSAIEIQGEAEKLVVETK